MKIGITGRNGFIGSALALELKDCQIYSYPRPDLDILFHFGSPSSDFIFKQNMDYCFSETIDSFLEMVRFCRDNKIKLVYPSSATVYNKATPYARGKSCLEEIHQAYGGDILGLRIFAGYGPGEEHKGEYSSIVYQFCQQMKKGENPVIYGDGKQTRDFVYIDDVVDTILQNLTRTGIIDIGTGVNTSFNEIVDLINAQLETDIKPICVARPQKYVNETPCSNPIKYKVDIKEGIKRICEKL